MSHVKIKAMKDDNFGMTAEKFIKQMYLDFGKTEGTMAIISNIKHSYGIVENKIKSSKKSS